MASLIIRKLIGTDIVLDDLGLTIQGVIGTEFDLMSESAENVSLSTDTVAAITASLLIVLDPRDNTTVLSVADSILAIQNHNLTHFGIAGGRFGAIDDPSYVPVTGNVVVVSASGDAEEVAPETIINSPGATEAVEDIVGAMLVAGTDTTTSYDDVAGTVSVNVADSFLRNTGDTLDSGTLTVAPGATIAIGAGGDLTITDAPVNATDAVNKAYVDSVASGLDAKESVQAGTTTDLGFVYADNGGVGDSLTSAIAGETIVDGITLEDGDRVLVKDQIDPTQNGIYTVSDAGAGTATVLTRAEDQDGSPVSEVSAGNFTYVENGITNGSTGWVTQGDGQLALNTDDVVWVQFSGAGTYTAGTGLTLSGTTFQLNVGNLATDTIVGADELAFNDVSDGTSNKTTVANFISDMDIVTSSGVGGFATETAPGVFTNRTLTIEGAGPLDGLSVSNGTGTAGDPIFGLDIQNLPSQTAIDATNDRVAVWDQTANANVYYTVGEIAGSVAATNSFETWVASGNFTGDNSLVADNATDNVTISGGAAINVNFDATSDTIEFSLTSANLTDTTSTGTDRFAFFDASNSDAPVTTTIADFINDNEIVTQDTFGTGTGILVKTGENPDTYTSRSVVASTTSALEGASVDNGDGVSGNIEVGVDIDNLTDSADNLSASDELIAYDGANNVSVSGQQIADGVADILNLPAMTVSTINGQPIVTLADTTRSNKILSIDSVVFTWGENGLSNLDWLQIGGNATDAESGFIMPMDGTIVYSTGHCENTAANSKDIHLFIDGVDQGSLGTLAGGANAEYNDNTINFDFNQGQKLRLRAVGAGTGNINDTVCSVFCKWRAS
jgi:hypothetical protein